MKAAFDAEQKQLCGTDKGQRKGHAYVGL